MGWKENKLNYIARYTKEKYFKCTVVIPYDSNLYNAIKDSPSKSGALKELAEIGMAKTMKDE